MTYELEVTYRQTWCVDPDKLRDAFQADLADDGAETDDEVIQSCWDNGVRDPYFIPTVDADEDYWITAMAE